MRTIAVALLSLVICFIAVSAEKVEAVPAFAKDWIGIWQLDGANEFLHIEPARFSKYAPDKGLSFFRASFVPGKIIIKNSVGHAEFPFEMKGKRLVMTSKQLEFNRLATLPPELEVKPFPYGKKAPAPAALKTIQAELLKRLDSDQDVRKNPFTEAMKEVDEDNVTYLKKLLTEYGWIDVTRFGYEASHAAFMIVQHSGELPLMVAALPEIEKDTKARKFEDAQAYALLFDRTNLYLGRKQRYGTQVAGGNEAIVVLALEDKANVEKRRKEIGIFPLSEYLEYFQQASGSNAPIKYEED